MSAKADEVSFLLSAGAPVVMTLESYLYFSANTLLAAGAPLDGVRRALRRIADSDALWEAWAQMQTIDGLLSQLTVATDAPGEPPS